MIHFFAYLLVYLLLALAFDLLRELFDPHGINRRYGAIRRRLWNETAFDCRSLVFSVDADPGGRRRPSPVGTNEVSTTLRPDQKAVSPTVKTIGLIDHGWSIVERYGPGATALEQKAVSSFRLINGISDVGERPGSPIQ